MFIKIFISILLLQSICFAVYQQISIGKIDNYYKDKITHEQLRIILDEIEDTFESQFEVNVFDYSFDGKPIDIIYLPPSKFEKQFKRKLDRLKRKKEKVSSYEDFFYKSQEEINILNDELSYKNTKLNNKIKNLNTYIDSKNKLKLSKEQYNKVVNKINVEKNTIKEEQKVFRKDQRKLNKLVSKYNNKIQLYNSTVNGVNILANELESMSRSYKKVKGRAFLEQEITFKTYYKNGKKVREKSVKNSAKKIEIYGFSSLSELKVILAHEIGHLIGLPHIEVEGALMNPILQDIQKEELHFTPLDVRNFIINF
jgi:hypothetical protein